MNLGIKKCLDAAMLPAVVLIVLGVILQLVSIFMPAAALNAELPVLVIDLAVLAWAGYRVVKGQGMDFTAAIVTGAIAGIASSFIGVIMGLGLMVLGFEGGMGALNAASGYNTTVLVIAVMIGFVVSVVFGAVEGAICGCIGAYVASLRK